MSPAPEGFVPDAAPAASSAPPGFVPDPVTTVRAGTQYTVGPNGKLVEAREDADPGVLKGVWDTLNPGPMVKQLYEAAKAAPALSGPELTLFVPKEILKNIGSAQLEQVKKGWDAFQQGHVSEGIGHLAAGALPVVGPMAAQAGEDIGAGKPRYGIGEAIGTLLPFLAKYGNEVRKTGSLAPTTSDAQAADVAARTAKASQIAESSRNDLANAIPPSSSAPYTPEDYTAARPHLEAQHQASPITTVEEFRDAADAANSVIEGRIASYLQQFGSDRLRVDPLAAVVDKLKESPRASFVQDGLKELSDLPLDQPLTLDQAEGIRRQLNAENKGVLKRNNYDRYTARTIDPGFAARETAAQVIRQGIYDQLEARGVPGVADLRRTEGSIINLRNAAERQIFRGESRVAQTAPNSVIRRALGKAAKYGTAGAGAYIGSAGGTTGTEFGAMGGAALGDELQSAIRGKALTRDELVARSFKNATTAGPTFPAIPPAPPVRGLIGPGPIVPPPPPDPSFVRGIPAEYGARVPSEEAHATEAARAPQVSAAPPTPRPPAGARRGPQVFTDEIPGSAGGAEGASSARAPYVQGSVIDYLVKRAQASGSTASPEDLRARASELYDALRETDHYYEQNGQAGKPLLRAVARLGGLSMLNESANKGEIAWLKDARQGDSFGGVKGVFREANGKSLDTMLEALHEEGFANIETINDLLDEVRDAGRIGKTPEPRHIEERLIKSLGPDWWKHIEPGDLQGPEEGDTSFDVNELEKKP